MGLPAKSTLVLMVACAKAVTQACGVAKNHLPCQAVNSLVDVVKMLLAVDVVVLRLNLKSITEVITTNLRPC